MQRIGPNLRRYPVSLFELHGPGVLLAAVARVLLARGATLPLLETRPCSRRGLERARHVEVADFAAAQPEPSLFVTQQHSGSLAY